MFELPLINIAFKLLNLLSEKKEKNEENVFAIRL